MVYFNIKKTWLKIDGVYNFDSRSPKRFFHLQVRQDYKLSERKEQKLIPLIEDVMKGNKKSVTIETTIENIDRTFGTTLSHHVTSSYPDGLPDSSIHLKLKGEWTFCLH